jgi:hypothetical protein
MGGWSGRPDAEPSTSVADLLAGLGVGGPEGPTTSIPEFMKQFGISNGPADGPGPQE